MDFTQSYYHYKSTCCSLSEQEQQQQQSQVRKQKNEAQCKLPIDARIHFMELNNVKLQRQRQHGNLCPPERRRFLPFERKNSSPHQRNQKKKVIKSSLRKFYNLGVGSQRQLFQPCFALAAWRTPIFERSLQPICEEAAPI